MQFDRRAPDQPQKVHFHKNIKWKRQQNFSSFWIPKKPSVCKTSLKQLGLLNVKTMVGLYTQTRPQASEIWASTVAQTVKNLPAMQKTRLWPLGREDPPEKGMATHSSIPIWRTPRIEEPGGLQSMGSQRVRHDWVTHLQAIIQLTSETWLASRRVDRGKMNVNNQVTSRPCLYNTWLSWPNSCMEEGYVAAALQLNCFCPELIRNSDRLWRSWN